MLKSTNLRHTRVVVAVLASAALLVSACSSSSGGNGGPSGSVVSGQGNGGSSAATAGKSGATAPTHKPTKKAKPKKPVHIKLLNEDGSEYGVGMPVIAFFSKKIKNAKPLQDATTVTVDGKKMHGAWYFEGSSYYKGFPIEAHFRLEHYWPAHAHIHIGIPTKGLSAGGNLAYDDSLTLDFSTGPANISTVDDSTHMMTVTTDGHPYGKFHVSLGAANTPTASGTKVIMEKGVSICMSGPGYNECGVKYTQRLTYGGEYLHAAPWNINNINNGVDSSNGCTNLLPSDAEKLYNFLRVGDVVIYPNANGPAMSLGAGYGDWNVNWGEWQTGGLVPTT